MIINNKINSCFKCKSEISFLSDKNDIISNFEHYDNKTINSYSNNDIESFDLNFEINENNLSTNSFKYVSNPITVYKFNNIDSKKSIILDNEGICKNFNITPCKSKISNNYKGSKLKEIEEYQILFKNESKIKENTSVLSKISSNNIIPNSYNEDTNKINKLHNFVNEIIQSLVNYKQFLKNLIKNNKSLTLNNNQILKIKKCMKSKLCSNNSEYIKDVLFEVLCEIHKKTIL